MLWLTAILVAVLGMLWAWVQVEIMPQLPAVDSLKEIKFQEPLRVYSADGKAIAEFGSERRIPLSFEEIPAQMVHAILAIEDARFYDHQGIDAKGLLRAAISLLKSGRVSQGGSTITMQVARNFFLTPEKRFMRKLKEMLLAARIEEELSKNDILTLYLNKIYLGQRAYGLGAAAQVYYGKKAAELSLAQCAMIAGLPKAPSANNPIANPKRALIRRNYILKRMLELEYIDQAAYQAAVAEPLSARLKQFSSELYAPYVAEMARAYAEDYYPDDTYSAGYRIYTTIDSRLQSIAQDALRNALIAYDKRHGYRGAVAQASQAEIDAALEEVEKKLRKWATPPSEAEKEALVWRRVLQKYPVYGPLQPALVLEVKERSASVFGATDGSLELPWSGISWARPYLNDNRVGRAPRTAADTLARGDIIYIQRDGESEDGQALWRLSQVPTVGGALVSLDPDSGAIVALGGGFDYRYSKFNRAMQAKRQAGSNFKPFIYSAALEYGFTAASTINDAPITRKTIKGLWRPHNYSGRFYGPTRLREALTKSRNLVSIRLLDRIGVSQALDYVSRFGFNPDELPHNLTLSLGTADLTPLQVVTGFAVFANGGYRVTPYFVQRIEDHSGRLVYQARPKTVCRECDLPLERPLHPETPELAQNPAEELHEVNAQDDDGITVAEGPLFTETLATPHAPRTITARNAWLMTSILKDVIRRGTARRALSLKRDDLAGKTGTTNDQKDAWFSGYNSHLVTTAWVGFDQPRSLGKKETGGRAALPMWIEFMGKALAGVPSSEQPRPPGLISARIDPETGLLARSGGMSETFFTQTVPTRYASEESDSLFVHQGEGENSTEEHLF